LSSPGQLKGPVGPIVCRLCMVNGHIVQPPPAAAAAATATATATTTTTTFCFLLLYWTQNVDTPA